MTQHSKPTKAKGRHSFRSSRKERGMKKILLATGHYSVLSNFPAGKLPLCTLRLNCCYQAIAQVCAFPSPEVGILSAMGIFQQLRIRVRPPVNRMRLPRGAGNYRSPFWTAELANRLASTLFSRGMCEIEKSSEHANFRQVQCRE